MKKKENAFKIVFSATFFVLAILITCFDWAKDKIDYYVITLILIGFIPWIIKYIKSFEISGMKLELFNENEIKKIEENIEKIKKESNKIIDEKISGNGNVANERSDRKLFTQTCDISDINYSTQIYIKTIEIDFIVDNLINQSKLKINGNEKLLEKIRILGKNKVIPLGTSKTIVDCLKKTEKVFNIDLYSQIIERDLNYMSKNLDFFIDLLCDYEFIVYIRKLSEKVAKIPDDNDKVKLFDKIIG